MTPEIPPDASAAFERLLTERPGPYTLRLYITGMTPRSTRSVLTIKTMCEQCLPGRYSLEVINLSEHPDRAEQDNIFATPALVKELPPPVRQLVGDLTNPDRVILVFE